LPYYQVSSSFVRDKSELARKIKLIVLKVSSAVASGITLFGLRLIIFVAYVSNIFTVLSYSLIMLEARFVTGWIAWRKNFDIAFLPIEGGFVALGTMIEPLPGQ
jgi:hypothetical protein